MEWSLDKIEGLYSQLFSPKQRVLVVNDDSEGQGFIDLFEAEWRDASNRLIRTEMPW